MTKMTYAEQLRHPNWQRKRLETMQSASFRCENCGDENSTLNVHHRRYFKGRMAWEYERADLACLCEKCHEQEHSEKDVLESILARGAGRRAKAIALVLGVESVEYGTEDEELEIDRLQSGSPYYLAGVLGSLVVDALVVEGAAGKLREALVLMPRHPALDNALALIDMFAGGRPQRDINAESNPS